MIPAVRSPISPAPHFVSQKIPRNLHAHLGLMQISKQVSAFMGPSSSRRGDRGRTYRMSMMPLPGLNLRKSLPVRPLPMRPPLAPQACRSVCSPSPALRYPPIMTPRATPIPPQNSKKLLTDCAPINPPKQGLPKVLKIGLLAALAALGAFLVYKGVKYLRERSRAEAED